MAMALDAIESAMRASPRRDTRHRIEHCGYPTPAQVRQMASLDVIPVNQPNFLVDSGDDFIRHLGGRAHRLQPIREELDAGIRLAHSLGVRHINDYISLSPSSGIAKIEAPATMIGHTIEELTSGQQTKLNVLLIKRGSQLITVPHYQEAIQAHDQLVIVGAYYSYPSAMHGLGWFAQGSYQRAVATQDGYRPGEQVSLTGGVTYSITQQVSLLAQLNALHKGRDTGPNAEPDLSGGNYVYAAPGLSVAISKNVQAYGFLQLPVYRKVNGIQLTARRAVVAGVSTQF